MDQAQTGRTSVSTIEHVPLKIEVLPLRRGIRVRLSLLLEKETSWTFELLAPDLPPLTDELVIFPWDQQVFMEGRWQPHPEIVGALAAQQKDSN